MLTYAEELVRNLSFEQNQIDQMMIDLDGINKSN
jgi:enolase